MTEDLNDRMKDNLDELQVTVPSRQVAISVRYDFARDLFEVWVLFPPEAKFKQPPKDLCHQSVNVLRSDLGFPANQSLNAATWPSYFAPNGYTLSEKADKALYKTLPKLVTIKVTVYKDIKRVECTGMLMEKTVSFQE